MIPADLAARLRLLNEAELLQHRAAGRGPAARARDPGATTRARPRPALLRHPAAHAARRHLPRACGRAADDAVAQQRGQVGRHARARGFAGDATRGVRAHRRRRDGGRQRRASAQPALSQTGRLISFLLTGQPTPQPASLAGNQPLLNTPPASGAACADVAPGAGPERAVLTIASGAVGARQARHRQRCCASRRGSSRRQARAPASPARALRQAPLGRLGPRTGQRHAFDPRRTRRTGRTTAATAAARIAGEHRRDRTAQRHPQPRLHRPRRRGRSRAPRPPHPRTPDAGGAPAARRAGYPAIRRGRARPGRGSRSNG